VHRNIVFKENTRIIKLDEKEKYSSEKRISHLEILLFCPEDFIVRKEVTVKYHPSRIIIADYLSKPLARKLFCKM